MVKYLLYFSTYHPVPASSILGMKIKENLEKGGNADNIAFWNWTPEQKNLLVAKITRMIMTSHWSTGKTRIIFEKAKILARNGNSVVVVLYYSNIKGTSYLVDQAPILLYSSLMNEIEQEKGDLKDNLKLLMINDLNQVEKHLKGTNIFIDEFVINNKDDLDALNKLYQNVETDNLLWVTVAKTSSEFTNLFKNWLEKKNSG